MKWSFRIGTIAGIGIFVHWTFSILLAWILYIYIAAGQGWNGALLGVLFICALFACVVFHELGHALAARRYGVETRDITLLPIGGVARLQRMPEHPVQEFIVAIAGPLVNVVIAGLLLAVLWPLHGLSNIGPGSISSGHFFRNLMWANVALVVFNLLPAFPMDGGRMLRALLASRIEYEKATQIAAAIGQVMAIAFAMLGLFVVQNPFLVFIALFVYLGAEGEAKIVQIRTLLRGVPVRDAMIRRYTCLAPDDPLSVAADELLAGSQQDFPIIDADQHFRGLLRRRDLAEALRRHGDATPVKEVMVQCPSVNEWEMLESVMERLREAGCNTLPVLRSDHVVGLVTLENIGEMMMIRAALRRHPVPDETEIAEVV